MSSMKREEPYGVRFEDRNKGRRNWREIIEDQADMLKENAGLKADKHNIRCLAVSAANTLSTMLPLTPRDEQRYDMISEVLDKIISISSPPVSETDIPY